MSDVTQILNAIDQGDSHAADQLLPLVYDELRQLAAAKLAHEKPGQTLDATGLVHEAYLRLVGHFAAGESPGANYANRSHFFAAAAEAMRRILIEAARRKKRRKHGGDRKRLELENVSLTMHEAPDELLIIDDALQKLEAEDPEAAQLVKLRFFAGLSVAEAAEMVGISRSSAYDHWDYARSWLHREMGRQKIP